MGASSSAAARQPDEGKTLVSIKAGKMDAVMQPNGKYLVTPIGTRRGEIRLVWQLSNTNTSTSGSSNSAGIASGALKFEWKDRRTNAKDLESVIFPEDRCSLSKVGRDSDRVYLFQYGENNTSISDQHQRRHFFWLQDKITEQDEVLITKFSRLLRDRAACIIEAGGTPLPSDYSNNADPAANITTTAGPNTATVTGTTTTPASASVGQVDALSSILENLGIPPPTQNTSSNARAQGLPDTNSGAVSSYHRETGGGGILTLSDLQGAMAGLATHSPLGSPLGDNVRAPPLNEIATADTVEASGVLNDPLVRHRLIELLPENQRTEEDLRQNLRSPQVQQALQNLTAAFAEDSAAFHDVIVNFSMKPDDGAVALANGDPIQAFLDCLLASVQREEGKNDGDSSEENKMEE